MASACYENSKMKGGAHAHVSKVLGIPSNNKIIAPQIEYNEGEVKDIKDGLVPKPEIDFEEYSNTIANVLGISKDLISAPLQEVVSDELIPNLKTNFKKFEKMLPDEFLGLEFDGFAERQGCPLSETKSNLINPFKELLNSSLKQKDYPIVCDVHKVLEPFKTRTITAGNAEPYTIARCFQKPIHSKMRKMDPFVLTGEVISEKLINDKYNYKRRLSFFDNKGVDDIVSKIAKGHVLHAAIDYSNATDGMHPDICQAYVNGICSTDFLSEKEKIVFNQTMDNHILTYPQTLYNTKKPKFDKEGNFIDPWTSTRLKTKKEVRRNMYKDNNNPLPGDQGKTWVYQSHGQLMGSPSSFPGLCAANFAVLWTAMNVYFRKYWLQWLKEFKQSMVVFFNAFVVIHDDRDYWYGRAKSYDSWTKNSSRSLDDGFLDLTEFKEFELTLSFEAVSALTSCLFNGDDGLFRTSQELYDIWKEIAPLAGLNLSVGKSYLTDKFIMINSTVFTQYNWLNDDFSSEDFHYVFSMNPGLIKGQGRVLGDTRGLDGGERLMPICDQLKWCLNGSKGGESVRIVERFKAHNWEKLSQSCRSWVLPRCLGGLELPFGDPPTYCQRMLAAQLMMEPDFVLPQSEKYTPDYTRFEKGEKKRLAEELGLKIVPGVVITTRTDTKKIPIRYNLPDLSSKLISPYGVPNYEDRSEELFSMALYKVLKKKQWLNPISDNLVNELMSGNFHYVPPGYDAPVKVNGDISEKICSCTILNYDGPCMCLKQSEIATKIASPIIDDMEPFEGFHVIGEPEEPEECEISEGSDSLERSQFTEVCTDNEEEDFNYFFGNETLLPISERFGNGVVHQVEYEWFTDLPINS